MEDEYIFESVLYTKEHERDFEDVSFLTASMSRPAPSLEQAKEEAREKTEEEGVEHVACAISKIGDSSRSYLSSYRVIPFYEIMVVGKTEYSEELKEYYHSDKYNLKIMPDYITGNLKVEVHENN